MNKEIGNTANKIWLIGDSNPFKLEQVLDTPLDPRHPTRHNIWTPICEVINDYVYKNSKLRLDSEKLYIRNAVENSKIKPRKTVREWSPALDHMVNDLSVLVKQKNPKVIFSFGSFSFEFCRRAIENQIKYKSDYWDTKAMGRAFIDRIDSNDYRISSGSNQLSIGHWGSET